MISIFSKINIPVLLLLTASLISLNGCSKTELDPNRPIQAEDKRQKNINEGRGASISSIIGNRGSTNYEFSSSNPLWRASLETIDFMPLSTVDYSGGVIITDWYGDSNNADESIKITVRFLSNEIQSNSIKIIIHNKKCKVNENCTISEIDSNIKFELQRAILAKAAEFDRQPKK